jgi:hypothetical protein
VVGRVPLFQLEKLNIYQCCLATPGKIIRPGYQKNLAAGRKNLPYPAAACMIIVDLFFLQQLKKYFGEL